MDIPERMNFMIVTVKGVIRASLVRGILLLLVLMVGSPRLPGLIMP